MQNQELHELIDRLIANAQQINKKQRLTHSITLLNTWKFSNEANGCFFLYSPYHPFIVYATPFFEDIDGIAIDIQLDGNSILQETIRFPCGNKNYWQNEVYKYESFDSWHWDNYIHLMEENLPRLLHEASVNPKHI